MRSISFSVICIVLLLVMSACEQPGEFRFGLPAVYLDIDSADLAKLQAGTYSKGRVPMRLRRGGVQEVGSIAVAGRSSVDDLRPSYSLRLSDRVVRIDAMSRDPSTLRARLADRVYSQVGLVGPEHEYVSVFINGSYQGLYSQHGLIDVAYVEAARGSSVGLYQATHTLGTLESAAFLSRSFNARQGDYEDLRAMIATLHQNPERLGGHIDLDAVVRYMAATFFVDNSDGIDNNYVLLRSKQDSRFSVLAWDMDYSFNKARFDPRIYFQRNALMLYVYNEPVLRKQFCEILIELGRVFSEQALQQILDFHIATIKLAHENDPILGAFPEALASTRERVLAYRRALRLDDCGL